MAGSRRGGRGGKQAGRGRARPAFQWLGSAGVVRQKYGGPSLPPPLPLSPRAAARRGRTAGRAGPPPGMPPPAPSRARRPKAAPARPAAVAEGRGGEVGGEAGRFLTPNGREERSLLRFVLQGRAFPSARRCVCFRFLCLQSGTHIFVPVLEEMSWLRRAGGKM